MKIQKNSFWLLVEQILPWLVLVILVLYTYAKFYEHAYVGFRANSDGEVLLIFVDAGEKSELQIGDNLEPIRKTVEKGDETC